MSEKIPARFRKTKTDKWAVMAPVADLEKALAEGGKVDVLKKSGDWSTFQVASLGRPFDVDGVEMCYGYGPEEDPDGGSGGGAGAASSEGAGGGGGERQPSRRRAAAAEAPTRDESEPMPEYQGSAEDEWSEF
jgi:hypothetical protein